MSLSKLKAPPDAFERLTPTTTGTSVPPSQPSSQSSSNAPQASGLPLTPPLSPAPDVGCKPSWTSVDATSSARSHQEYLDSLQPPTEAQYARLASLQEQREKQHRRRNREVERQSLIAARRSMEARRDFMKTKAEGNEQKEQSEHSHRSIFGQRSSRSSTRPESSNKTTPYGQGVSVDEDSINSKAAIVIQRTYRGYRVRREMQGLGIDARTRWTHAIRDAQWREVTMPRAREQEPSSPANDGVSSNTRPSTSRSNAQQNWLKVARIARRAGADEDSDHSAMGSSSLSSSPSDGALERMSSKERQHTVQKKKTKAKAKRQKHAQMMGLQYFLEMVDLKHRYGSNLRTYHQQWKKSNTNENFFYWLDYGEGRNVDLSGAGCPRERLDREQVRYLTREERQHYLVKVDSEGRLVWAKNNVRIDTTEEWRDSIHGIVPANDKTPSFAPDVEKHIQSKPSADSEPQLHNHSDATSNSSRESELEAAAAAKYVNPGLDNEKGVKKIKHVSAATIFNKLLRKSVRKNTWIFVADTSFRLYVGIKNSGAFQHSSFLHGSRISAAGLIKVKSGRLSSLSPLSGHYRPPASNFRAFVHSLEEEGVDMSHVSISKSYAVLVGLETYIKAKTKGKEVLQKMTNKKQKVFEPEEARKREEAEMDTSESAAKERKFLEKEREREEQRRVENKVSVKLLQKIGVRPRTPARQEGDGSAGEAVAPEPEP